MVRRKRGEERREKKSERREESEKEHKKLERKEERGPSQGSHPVFFHCTGSHSQAVFFTTQWHTLSLSLTHTQPHPNTHTTHTHTHTRTGIAFALSAPHSPRKNSISEEGCAPSHYPNRRRSRITAHIWS